MSANWRRLVCSKTTCYREICMKRHRKESREQGVRQPGSWLCIQPRTATRGLVTALRAMRALDWYFLWLTSLLPFSMGRSKLQQPGVEDVLPTLSLTANNWGQRQKWVTRLTASHPFHQLPTLLTKKELDTFIFYFLKYLVCANITTFLFSHAHTSVFQAAH